MTAKTSPNQSAFADEVARLRDAKVAGESGRLRMLFEYLAARGPEAAPATQADIADAVFNQSDSGADDATVRVYIHRLRKRLDEHYAKLDPDVPALTIPAGSYALRFASAAADTPASAPASRHPLIWLIAAGVLALLAGLLVGRVLSNSAPAANELWAPFLASERPIMIVVGDYYIYGEIDPVRPEEGRLIRDFRVNSPTDLLSLQEAAPDRYGNAEDVGLSYLPTSSAYALNALLPVLARHSQPIGIMPASALTSDTVQRYNLVYVGLFSGMGLLEDIAFTKAGYSLGESYDELIDKRGNRRFVSEEARSLASPVYYRDYGYVARFNAPGGALVAVVSGARDTALRGVAPLVASDLPGEMAALADEDAGLEALFQVTGQQGADLSERLLAARKRD